MVSGDTSADNAVTGYVVGEQIILTATPVGTSYSWAISKPSGASARASLSDTDTGTVKFTPDAEGYYVVTVNVSGTDYVLRIAAVAVGTVSALSVANLLPLEDDQVPAPATGASLYFSTTQDALAVKFPDNSVSTIDLTAVP